MKNNLKNKKNPFKLKFRIVLIVVFFLLFFAYLLLLISPTGTFKFKHNFKNNIFSSQGFISDIRPGVRIDLKNKNSLLVKAEPVYFSILSPRNFDKVKLKIKYKNNLSTSTPIVKLGILKDRISNSYDFKTIENSIIDNNFSKWFQISKNNLNLFQKNENYNNLEDFFIDLENNKLKDCVNISQCLISYNFEKDLNINFKSTDIKDLIIDQDLKGSHSFYVYFNKEENDLKINYRDLNIKEGNDDIEFRVYREDRLIEKIKDKDYNSYFENLHFNEALSKSVIESVDLSEYILEEGLYKIEIVTTDDVVIDKIISSSDKLVFINHIWPVSKLSLNTYYTKASSAQFKTYRAESYSEVSFIDKKVEIKESYKNYYLENQEQKLGKIVINKSDIIINTNGLIALEESNYFSKSVKEIDRFFKLSSDEKYLIANYKKPEIIENNKKLSEVEFNIEGLKRKRGKYDFVISIPGLELNENLLADNYENYLEIEEIEVEFNGKNIIEKMKEYLNNVK